MNTVNGKLVLGVGIDILEIERIRKALERHGARMLMRLYTEEEQNYCLQFKDPIPHLAARFCAKEAVVKALGTGFGEHASWQDVIILNTPSGKPEVHLTPWLSSKLFSNELMLSISHSQNYVTAVALWVHTPKKD